MARSLKSPRLNWSQIGLLAMLGALVFVGQLVNGRTLLQALVALSVGAFVLLLVWLWHLTLERSRTPPPLTARQSIWNAVVFLTWLTVMGVLLWWFWIGH